MCDKPEQGTNLQIKRINNAAVLTSSSVQLIWIAGVLPGLVRMRFGLDLGILSACIRDSKRILRSYFALSEPLDVIDNCLYCPSNEIIASLFRPEESAALWIWSLWSLEHEWIIFKMPGAFNCFSIIYYINFICGAGSSTLNCGKSFSDASTSVLMSVMPFSQLLLLKFSF